MPSKSNEIAVTTVSRNPLADALVKIGLVQSMAKYEESEREQTPIVFGGVRQKDLVGGDGKVIRSCGKFFFGKKDDLTYEDREELLLTVIGVSKGRVYFKSLDETEPTCKSIDLVHGSAERKKVGGHQVFGDCDTCHFNQWGSNEGKGKKCRENRRIFCMDWSNNRPFVLTLTTGSLKAWAAHADHIYRTSALLTEPGKEVGFLHHLLQVKATLQYKQEPAGHFIVQWGDVSALPRELQERMEAERNDAIQRFQEAANRTEFEADDFTGQNREPGEDSEGEAY